jgi:hypothetical protein
MPEVTGFWCYAHEDDDNNDGRIVTLHDDLIKEYRGLTADTIEIFLDNDAIQWGERWRERRDSALAAGNFLVAVITPIFFTRPECRHELQQFMQDAVGLGIKDLVLPILYIDVPSLEEENPSDSIVRDLKQFQWEPCQELRLVERDSEVYRRAVNKMALRLVRANTLAESIDIGGRALERRAELIGTTEGAPGFVDRVARMEQAFPEFTRTTEELTAEANSYRELLERATADAQDVSSYVERAEIMRRLVQEITDPVERIYELSSKYAAEAQAIDSGVRALIQNAPSAIAANPSSRAQICSYFHTVQNLRSSMLGAQESTAGWLSAISGTEALSSDIRPSMRRLREALTIQQQARESVRDWIDLIEATNVDCQDEAQPGLGAEDGRP